MRMTRRHASRWLATRLSMCVAGLLGACAAPVNAPMTPSGAPRKFTALPDHPRLMATPTDWQTLAARRASDPDLNLLLDLLLIRARSDLKRDPLERKLEGKRLLGVSREFIRRSLLWVFAFQVTHERVFFDRARRELLAVAAFADWNPSHFLDVAELTAGLAISYDWLYHDLSPEDRRTIRHAIIDKGLDQARHGHKTFALTHNWGQVCIGAMVLGALAVAEDEPELTRSLLAAASKHAFTALDAYKPDGAYPEGPSYWNYGTTYEILLIAALRNSMGTDWGLMDAPGLKRSAAFYAHSISPSGKHFNFSDSGEGQELALPLFYLARELQQPGLIDAKRLMIRNRHGLNERYAPLIALWWPQISGGQSPALNFVGQGSQPVAIWRSSWHDPNAFYFAIKGGGASHNHAHMDAGSFVLDLDGIRWAKDLGMQDYNSLESRGIDLWNMKQNSARWQVFRLGNAGHNTLSMDKGLHNALGMATLQMQGDDTVMLDLTPVFLPGQLKQARRTAHIEGQSVTLSDSVTGAKPGSDICWSMNTEAAITLNGNHATLKHEGKTVHVRFYSTNVRLVVVDISKPRADFDFPNPNTRQLVASAPTAADGSWWLNARFSRD